MGAGYSARKGGNSESTGHSCSAPAIAGLSVVAVGLVAGCWWRLGVLQLGRGVMQGVNRYATGITFSSQDYPGSVSKLLIKKRIAVAITYKLKLSRGLLSGHSVASQATLT